MELYYFSRRFISNGILSEELARYFSIEDKPEARWLAEKTPEYSHSYLAPYRVRATLQTKSLALVFTVREPLDAYVSNYFYSIATQKYPFVKASATGFLAWGTKHLDTYISYTECLGKTLWEYGLIENSSLVQSAPQSWYGVQSIDEGVFERCRVPHIAPGDGVRSWLYSQSMRRWRRVLPNVPMMCVFHEDFIKDPTAEARRVVEFLGLDGGKFTQLKPYEGGYVGPEERLRALEGAKDEPTASEIKKHLKALRAIFKGELEFAKQFCSELERNGYRK